MPRNEVRRRERGSWPGLRIGPPLIACLIALVGAMLVAGTSVDSAVAGPDECRDRVDNDSDGLIDQLDPGCRGPKDRGEADGRQRDDDDHEPSPTATPTPTPTPTPEATPAPAPPPARPACSDGRDNDGDAKVDQADPGCGRRSDDDEADPPAARPSPPPSPSPSPSKPAPPPATQCSDGVDNDKDAKTDAGQDPGCPTSADDDETDPPAPAAPPPAGEAFGFTGASTPPRRARRLLAPFPVVRIAGRIYRTRVRIRLLTVRAPAGATISVRCRGRSCARSTQRLKARSSRVNRRLHRFERTLRAGTVVEIRVYKTGMIGKYTRFTVRRASLPSRSDRCLSVDHRRARSCPAR